MNRPSEIIKELTLHKSHDYGYEVSYRECRQLVDYIHDLEKALDKACDVLKEIDACCKPDTDLSKECGECKKCWKEYFLKDE